MGLVKPNTFTSGTRIYASEVNANFDRLYDVLTGVYQTDVTITNGGESETTLLLKGLGLNANILHCNNGVADILRVTSTDVIIPSLTPGSLLVAGPGGEIQVSDGTGSPSFHDLTLTGVLTVQGTGVSSFAGPLGIGTTTPVDMLEVEGANPRIRLKATDVDGGAGLYIEGNGTGSPSMRFLVDGAEKALFGWHTPSALTRLYDFGVANNVMTWHNGMVGVGPNVPSYLLDVRDVGNITSRVKSNDGTVTFNMDSAEGFSSTIQFKENNVIKHQLAYVAGSDVLRFYAHDGAVTTVAMSDAGNVGVGTTSPLFQFHVEGDGGGIYLNRLGVDKFPYILFGADSVYMGQVRASDAETISISNSTGGIHYFNVKTGGTNAGFVGIGTTDPQYTLDIQATEARVNIKDLDGPCRLYIDGGGGQSGGIQFKTDGVDNFLLDFYTVPANNVIRFHSYDYPGIVMAIDTDNSRVGINTIQPGYPLDIRHDNVAMNLQDTALSGTYLRMGHASAIGYINVVNGSGHSDFELRSANVVRMHMDGQQGNFGIGVANPLHRLHVYKSGAISTIAVDAQAGQNASMAFLSDQVPQWSIYREATTNNLIIHDDDSLSSVIVLKQTGFTRTNHIQIDAVNGILIDGASGGFKGQGTINCSGLYVGGNTAYPDYVFGDYPLPSIDEMTQFYKEHSHLPTINRGDDAVELSSLSNQLWETVEVHALYITQLHNRIKELEARI